MGEKMCGMKYYVFCMILELICVVRFHYEDLEYFWQNLFLLFLFFFLVCEQHTGILSNVVAVCMNEVKKYSNKTFEFQQAHYYTLLISKRRNMLKCLTY